MLSIPYSVAAENDWMPDTNLKQAVRDQLELPEDIPLTQLDMKRLTGLDARNRRIEDLTGLEHATQLTWANLGGNDINNIDVLSGLVNLKVLYIWGTPLKNIQPLEKLIQMNYLHLASNQIVDIRPIAKLVLLETLNLHNNQVSDIRSLAKLTQLKELTLSKNQIVDISPLASLSQLTELHIQNNQIVDFSPLQHLTLSEFLYDEICSFQRTTPAQDRINHRSYPSVFQPWTDILNRPSVPYISRVALHDLSLQGRFGLEWQQTEHGIVLIGDLSKAKEERDEMVALNPNLIFITSVHVRDSYVDRIYTENYPYWVRDSSEAPVEGWPGTFLLDFTHPEVQNVIVEQARALSRCGLFDGVFLDWWREDTTVLDGYRTNESEQQARDVIIKRIREAVGEDFLILVNPNRTKPKRASPYINGLFMETGRDNATGYTYEGLEQIESTLLWAEENLRTPQINCLQAWSIATENPIPSVNYRWTRLVDSKPDTPNNLRWVRAFTTMTLTISDAYIDYYSGYLWRGNIEDRSFPYNFWDIDLGEPVGMPQQHYWFDFWDADLGVPVGEKAQLYENVQGLFIRKFTNGWAVYNRSGLDQEIILPIQTTSVAKGFTGFKHTVADLDGEMFLINRVNVDVNRDGKVNILDLVSVANGFGNAVPDLNEDGVVNIQDLVIVANAIGQ